MADEQVEVSDDEARRRYVVTVDGEAVGRIDYRDRSDGVRDLVHTEVDPAMSGRGLAGRLARFALDDVRAKGWTLVPTCPYIASYLDKHPEYADLVAD